MDLALSLFGNHSTEGYISGKDIASVSYCFELNILCMYYFKLNINFLIVISVSSFQAELSGCLC